MIRQNILAAVAAAVLMFMSSSAFAEMANGSYNHDFSGEVPLWDISGSYSDSETSGSLDFTLSETPSGVLTGTGTYHYDDGTVTLDGPAIITGKVTSAGTATRVSLKALITGTGTYLTDNLTFTATETVNAEIHGAAGQLVLISGRANVKLKDLNTGKRGSGSSKLDPGSTLDLPAGSDGDWNLTLDLVPNGIKKYDGTASTASVGTSTGGTVDLTPTGNYSSKTDRSNITLKGPKGTGASLNLLISTTGSNLTVYSAKGKLYGQNIKFTAP